MTPDDDGTQRTQPPTAPAGRVRSFLFGLLTVTLASLAGLVLVEIGLGALRGHIEAAVIEYEKARAVDPSVRDDPKLARRLGELYLELDRPEEALPLLILAGEDDPDNANVAAAEARARRLTGDVEGARAALDRALRQNPFIPGIHCDLAALAALEGQQDVATRESALCHDR